MNWLGLLQYWRVGVFLVLLGALGIQTLRLDNEKEAYEEYRVDVEATAKAAQEKADATAAHYELLLEEANETYKARTDRLKRLHSVALRGMLDSVTSRDFLPPAPGDASSSDGDVASIDRGKLNLGFTASLQQLAAELGTVAGVGEGIAAALAACAAAWPGSQALGASHVSPRRGDDVVREPSTVAQ